MKKRILSLLLAVCLTIAVLPLSTFASSILYGDVNSDGEINMRDVLAMKQYIAQYGNNINEAAADVTSDKNIDARDLLLLKKYIASWDVLLGPAIHTITFNSNGGTEIPPVQIRQGEVLSDVPAAAKDGSVFLGWYIDASFATQFFAADEIFSDLNLYAKYAPTELQEQNTDDTYTLGDQATTLAFNLVSSNTVMSANDVLAALTLVNIGKGEYINLKVTGTGGNYTVTADGGFEAGASYTLTIGDDALTYKDRPSANRICTFTIAKAEVMNVGFNSELKYIKSNLLSNITVNGEAVDSLSVSPTATSETGLSGTFDYADASTLKVGDKLCVFDSVKPADRNTTDDYTDDNLAYVDVTAINGDTVSYKGAETKDIIATPDTLPLTQSQLATYTADTTDGSFTVTASSLDFSSYSNIGLDASTKVDVNDYVAITENDSDIILGKITSVTTTAGIMTANFEVTTAEKMQSEALDYYTRSDVSGEDLLSTIDVAALKKQIKNQVIASGFADKALNFLATTTEKTDGFKKLASLDNYSMTTSEGNQTDAQTLKALGFTSTYETEDGMSVTVEIDTNTEHFGKGFRILLQISGEKSFSNDDSDNEISVSLTASFTEEVRVESNVKGKLVWSFWKGFFPYISDVEMNANIDAYNYTGFSFNATVQLKEKDTGDIDVVEVTDELTKLMDSDDESEISAGRQNLFEEYGKMLENDSSYVDICDQSLVDQHIRDPYYIIDVNIKADFVVGALINISLGCNTDYISGTRYNFWFGLMSKTAGNSRMDLIDESFGFQFYVMGHLGLRAGLRLEFAVGLFDTRLNSIGIIAEAGVYVELFGYFFYEYDSTRAPGESQAVRSSKMSGALYLEFGIYLEVSFKAQLGDGKLSFNPTLYSNQWPLLSAGERINVYDFGYDQPEENDVVLIKDVTKQVLPDSIRYMDCLDLKEGDLSVNEYDLNKFYYSLTNKYFSLDKATGEITVSVPEDVRYMECDLKITWKPAKLAFSKEDLTRTVHLVWTNLTDTELKEKYDVSVKVGKNIVWSMRVNRGEIPVLPTEEEVLALIGYDKNVVGGTNLKYTGYTGYNGQVAVPVITKQTYNFDATERNYTLTIKGVQNADGTKSDKTFTAKFGEKFDLSSLAKTGTRIAGTTYTSYLKTACNSVDGRAVTDIIDSAFGAQLIAGTYSYTAEYVDNSCKVTYKFNTADGLTLPTKTEIVEKGTVPVFDYSEYLIGQGTGYAVKSWDVAIGKVTGDTTFTALCGEPTGAKYTITYNTNGGSSIAPVQRYEGSAITAPVEPTKTGYTFSGWYSDSNLTLAYTFAKMGNSDFTLYAKWTANQYTVSFDTNEGDGTADDITVTYDDTYGTLPTVAQEGYVFNGWFTAATGGTKITNTTTVAITANQTLFAQWVEKQVVTGLNLTPQTTTYNTQVQNFALTGSSLSGFKVQYKKPGDTDWNDTAINAGVYAIMITRPEDANYKAYEKTITDGFIINRLARTITSPPTATNVSFSSITVDAAAVNSAVSTSDGTIQYAASTANSAPASGWGNTVFVSGLRPGTRYYIFARIVNGMNYLDATSTTGLSVNTPALPTDSWSNHTSSAFINSYSDTKTNYTINDESELAAFMQLVTTYHHNFTGMTVTLAKDMDMSAYLWNTNDVYNTFSGTFDGDGHTIKGLVVLVVSESRDIGFIGSVSGGTVKNITFTDGYLGGKGQAGSAVGKLQNGHIENIINYNTVAPNNSQYASGIVNKATDSTITNCHNYGTVLAYYDPAGIVADASNTVITNCSNSGLVSGDALSGGIVSQGSAVTIKDCYNTGDIVSTASGRSGGIIAIYFGDVAGTIINCYNTGNITGANSVGGIIGRLVAATNISNCYNIGKITATNASNKLCGSMVGEGSANATITNCYNYSSTGSNFDHTDPVTNFATDMSLTGGYKGTATLLDALNAWVTDNTGYRQWIIDPVLGYPVFKTNN